MVDFVQLQEITKDRLEQDRAVQYVEVAGPTLEAAVSDAASLLDVLVRHLDYEVLEVGSSGIFGMGKKEWRIQAYERVSKRKRAETLFEEEEEEALPVIEDRDGAVFLQMASNGDALLKVTPASGNGRKASETYAMQYLSERKVHIEDRDLVGRVIAEALGDYVKIGTFEHHSYNDSVVIVEISDDEMHAYIKVSAPSEGGADISYDTYINTLKSNLVVHGIKEDTLRNFIDQPIYGEKIEIAEGSNPVNGKDAYIQYNFQRDLKSARLREGSNGRIDFKELNIIQNVVENQPLAKKIPHEKGVPGKTVTGKSLPAKDGRDIALPVGTKVHVAEDGETILADISGQVVIVNELINVEPVFTVNGDVNLKTGNIIFLGTVLVTGNIEDGFSIKAAGNIEVKGSVAKADLDAEGDIIIHQGINAKGGGSIRAGKSLWARFIQNANVKAGDMVVASDGIINSQVDAYNRIICQGKRANIMGGRLRASEEINAKALGNPSSGTETICEVGFDPRSKEELDRLQEIKATTEKQLEEIKLNMQTLINIKQQKKTLPEDKEAYLQEMMDKRNAMITDIKKAQEGIKKIQEYLATLKTRGKVSASAKVYPGVKIVIRDIKDEVRTEYSAVTFILENELIRVSKYEEPGDEAKKGPDGYSTN
ncbi:MAG: FapA family protein [Treponema sp.]|jgi:uncharacterized protein (DUF342 family)|nr:FapA family protein [Treponema sp.]